MEKAGLISPPAFLLEGGMCKQRVALDMIEAQHDHGGMSDAALLLHKKQCEDTDLMNKGGKTERGRAVWQELKRDFKQQGFPLYPDFADMRLFRRVRRRSRDFFV